jgi:glycosyltransferase involved in cell wall biosynthesis
VCANTTSLPEIAGKAAILVEPQDIDGLAGAISAMLDDEVIRSGYAQAGRARAAEFSWQRTADRTADAYRKVLGAAIDA